MRNTNFGFIGCGRLANALAPALAAAGLRVAAVADRDRERAESLARRLVDCRVEPAEAVVEKADITFLSVPDCAIAGLAAALPWRRDTSAVHCSGAIGLDVLDPVAAQGGSRGNFHPFLSLGSDREHSFAGCVIGIEGDDRVRTILTDIAGTLGAAALPLAGIDRAAYHAAGVFAANYLVTLVAAARQLWKDAGLQDDLASRALGCLAESVVRSLQSGEPAAALTGPIARGDTGTIRRHLDWLDAHAPDLAALYRDLGLRTAEIAREGGLLEEERADAVRAALR